MPILPISSLRAAVTNAGGTPTQYTHVGLLRELITAWGGTPTQWAINPLLKEAISAASGTPTKHDTIYLLRELVTALGGTPTGFNGGALWDQVASLSASIGGSPVNTVAPSISGTRGGTLTATPGTWTGATSVSGQWYADGVATGNTTTSFTDSDTSKSLEYRETALPGSVVASGYMGAFVDPPQTFSDNFDDNSKNTALWGTNGAFFGTGVTTNGTVNETNQRLEVTPPASTAGNNANGYISAWTFDFTGASLAASIAVVSTWSGSTIPYLGIGSDANNGYQIDVDGGSLYIAKYKSGARTLVGTGPVFSATTHKFLRLRHGGSSDDTFYMDTSPDGAVWTQRTSAARDAAVAITNVKVVLGAFIWAAEAAPGTIGFDNLTTTAVATSGPTSNVVTSAAINVQPATTPGNKQLDFTATISAVGATGAQYKVETEAGQFVQGWTTATFSSPTANGTYPIAPFGFEGQKLKLLIRNIGGTVNTAAKLTATNGYVMSTPMQVGIGDNGWISYVGDSAGRDWFESREFGIIGIDHNSSRSSFNLPGLTVDNYNHWAEAYSPTQNYPDASGHEVCRYQGLSWRTTDSTSKLRAAPNTANLSGAGGDWKLTGEAPADASLVGLTADGMPTKLPDDPNLTIFFQGTWTPPKARSDVGFTVACKTQPGIWVELVQSLGTSRIDPASRNLTTGTFTITYDPTTFANYNGIFYVDRSKCTATLDSTFFLSGIPSYETGTPSADIGVPYASVDKLSDMAPFAGTRFMGALPIQRFAGNWNGTFTAANNTVSGSLRQWRHLADMANRLGWKYIWLNEPDGADSTYRTAMATFFRDNLNVGIIVILERSNEQWNNGAGGYQNAIDLLTRCNALAAGDAAKGFNYLLHCREHNAMVAVWKSVFGAAYTSRVKPVLAWQSITSISQWQTMLDFENTWQNVGYVSIAPYVDGNIGTYNSGATGNQASMNAAILAGNQANFNTALSSYLTAQTDYEVGLCKAIFDFLPGYSMGKGLDKNAIQVGYYEAGFFAVNYGSFAALGAGCDTTAMTYFNAFKRSNTGIGAAFAYYIDQIRLKAPGPMQTFIYTARLGNLTTADSWGMMDGTGQTTQEPFATVKAKALAYN